MIFFIRRKMTSLWTQKCGKKSRRFLKKMKNHWQAIFTQCEFSKINNQLNKRQLFYLRNVH